MANTTDAPPEKGATPDRPAGLPTTVPHTAIDNVLDVWRPLKNEKPPETPIEVFFRHVGPTMKALVAVGWPVKTLYEKAKPAIPGVSLTVFRRHAEPYLPDAPKKTPKAERRASKRAENAAAREAVRDSLDRVQSASATVAAPPPAEPVPAVPAAAVAHPAAPAQRVDYRGTVVEIVADFDRDPPAIDGMQRAGDRRLVGRGPGDNAVKIREYLLGAAGARDVRIEIVQPAPAPAPAAEPEEEEFAIRFGG